ncbi:hypothetical protein GE061_011767 [Apolygus lucorum]|uniref:Uncharacterized protein n=1 Tax=Apolygus lucorum TaxID=248454 RepID=A0A6A4K8T4_APOLU|nr:hypothetical protein GE061_011767 [Apolygus lucorum]
MEAIGSEREMCNTGCGTCRVRGPPRAVARLLLAKVAMKRKGAELGGNPRRQLERLRRHSVPPPTTSSSRGAPLAAHAPAISRPLVSGPRREGGRMTPEEEKGRINCHPWRSPLSDPQRRSARQLIA